MVSRCKVEQNLTLDYQGISYHKRTHKHILPSVHQNNDIMTHTWQMCTQQTGVQMEFYPWTEKDILHKQKCTFVQYVLNTHLIRYGGYKEGGMNRVKFRVILCRIRLVKLPETGSRSFHEPDPASVFTQPQLWLCFGHDVWWNFYIQYSKGTPVLALSSETCMKGRISCWLFLLKCCEKPCQDMKPSGYSLSKYTKKIYFSVVIIFFK